MVDIEFYDRKREIDEIVGILNTRPDLINFIYEPINSGKSTLMIEIIKSLPKDFVTFCIDLREKFVASYEDFIKVLFEVHRKRVTDYTKFIVKALESLHLSGIPIPKDLLAEMLRERETENVFAYIIEVFERIRDKGKIPVLILDELQVIGDLKIDELLIYRLFNLFVSLTKKRHLAHVFAITSDSVFIEKVYEEAMLHGRCRYILVDDFDYNTTKGFLKKYEFSDDQIELIWQYLGGKTVYLVEAVRIKSMGKDLRSFCDEMLKIRLEQLFDAILPLENVDRDLYERVLGYLRKFEESEYIEYRYITDEIRFLIKNNVLFADPVKRIVKPQSRLDLLAIRKFLKEVG